MKILMVNKFFYIKGGSETYYFALKRMLEAEGHEVIDFSMKDGKNYDSPYAEYFVEGVDYNGKMSLGKQVKSAANIIYSVEARKKLEELIKATRPDICHLHIFQHQLSPSILPVLKKYNIPVVYTAHDLKMLCLNYVMMTRGEVCERCKGGNYMNCLKYKCTKDSTLKSAINVAEGYLHKWLGSYDIIDKIVTPSGFYRRKFIEFGVDADRVIHIPNFLDRTKPLVKPAEDKEDYFLYFGRLSREKGIMTLIKSVEDTHLPLKIVGTGPCKEEIEQYIADKNLEHIQVLGFRSGQELIDLVGNARAVILPSEWYENGPYSAIESLQLGRPIIGSELGGIPELVDGNGVIFNHGNVEELKQILLTFPEKDSEAYKAMCARSEEIYQSTYTAKCHWAQLKPVYEEVIAKKQKEN